MQRLLSSKIMVIVFLSIVFLIAFGVIRGTIYERQSSYQQVMQEIARDHVNAQTILTPFIMVPVSTSAPCAKDATKVCVSHKQVIISPESITWKNHVDVSDKSFRRGIYRAISYQNQAVISGRFVISEKLLNPSVNEQIDWANASMRIYITDMRGVTSKPLLTINQQKFYFDFSHEGEVNPLGVDYTYIALADLQKKYTTFDFTVSVEMAGTSSLQVLPLGKEMKLSMEANWPHPSFFGDSLPTKNISNTDFTADWKNTYLANRNTQLLAECMATNAESCLQLRQPFNHGSNIGAAFKAPENNTFAAGSFGVNFIQAVDIYLMTDRAIKYAALFLVITFGAFFLFEVLKELRIHPMQYALVGAALAVFYGLLLSFSEHVDFALAYGVSSIACISLITFYVSYVLKSVGRSLVLSTILTAMYGTLFVILQSEDFTMMLGSVLVFILLAVMMFLTRHVDWYALGQKTQPE